MAKNRGSRFVPKTSRDLLVVLVTNQEQIGRSVQSLLKTQQNLVAAVKLMAGQVGRLTGQVDTANQWLSGIDTNLKLKALGEIEQRSVPHVNASEKTSTESSEANQEKPPSDPAAQERKKSLDRLKDWVTKLGLVRSILLSVVTIIPTIGAVIFAAWKLLSWLKPGKIPPPPNPPMPLSK